MLYHLGDKFVILNTLCEVKFINNGKAWLFPIDDEHDIYFGCVAIAVIDEKGRTKDGQKAKSVNNRECGAV